jgi:hypothetical protein
LAESALPEAEIKAHPDESLLAAGLAGLAGMEDIRPGEVKQKAPRKETP